jgi:hypothetical protein
MPAWFGKSRPRPAGSIQLGVERFAAHNIEGLVAVREILRSEMPGEPRYGGLASAGLPAGKSARNGGLRASLLQKSALMAV